MVQILSFDSRSIRSLLDEKHAALFEDEFPIIFKLDTVKDESNQKMFHRCVREGQPALKHSAIDNALDNNQIEATRLMINHVVLHQNSYVYSYLFEHNLSQIMEMGIHVTKLLESNVFIYKIDF
jgi:hypothetical protein